MTTKPTIQIGATYTCKIGKNLVSVIARRGTESDGWIFETPSGKTMTIRDPKRLIQVAPDEQAPEPKGGRVKGQMSGLDAAATILRERANEPMNTTDLVAAAHEAGYWAPEGKTPAATLYSAILREIQKKGDDARFTKATRGKFALRS